MTTDTPAPEENKPWNRYQQLYVRYLSAVLMDLPVINLFDEYWDAVIINSFSISLLAAILLQIMLQASIALEHHVGSFVQERAGAHGRKARIFSAWAVLFVSKLVILEALSFTFGDEVQFIGIYHGLIPFLTIVIAMLAAEAVMRRIYHALGQTTGAQPA